MSRPRVYVANRDGRCGACGAETRPGDQIGWIRGEGIVQCPKCAKQLNAAGQAATCLIRVVSRRNDTMARATLDEGQKALPSWPVASPRARFTVFGELGDSIRAEDVLEVRGHWSRHPKWGPQLDIISAVPAVTGSVHAVCRFLCKFDGIGLFRARAIVDHFGGLEGVIDMLDNDHTRLCEINGITPERAELIFEQYADARAARDAVLLLGGLQVRDAIINAAVQRWGNATARVVQEDPYRLAKLPGVSIAAADTIALRMGVASHDPRRCEAMAHYSLEAATRDGHTWHHRAVLTGADQTDRLAQRVAAETKVPPQLLDRGLDALLGERERVDGPLAPEIVDVAGDGSRLALRSLRSAEQQIAADLRALVEAEPTDEEPLQQALTEALAALDLSSLHPLQAEAVRGTVTHRAFVLTGGPGTGKTHTLRQIVDLYDATGARTVLAAPTGKAADRITEATGRAAKTIHRLLEYAPTSDDWLRCRSRPLATDLVVVDEASMIDVPLMARLLDAIDVATTRLLIVGDPYQLPSVGPGNVLRDILQSTLVQSVQLTHIYRQAQDNAIPHIAAGIHAGATPDLERFCGMSFYFARQPEPDLAATAITEAVSGILQRPSAATDRRAYALDEIQVIAAQYKGATGVTRLNRLLQHTLNPYATSARAVRIGREGVAALGDRVVATKNDYDNDIMNGTTGKVLHANQDGYKVTTLETDDASLVQQRRILLHDIVDAPESVRDKRTYKYVLRVRYGDKIVDYQRGSTDHVELAWCLTVHRSQGSQFPCVVIPVTDEHHYMLTRRLFYTAVTRGTEFLLLVGDLERVHKATANVRDARRLTALADLLVAGQSAELGLGPIQPAKPTEPITKPDNVVPLQVPPPTFLL